MLPVLDFLSDHSDIYNIYIETRPIVEPWYIAGILKILPEFLEFYEFQNYFEMLLVLGSLLDHSDICIIETRPIVEP